MGSVRKRRRSGATFSAYRDRVRRLSSLTLAARGRSCRRGQRPCVHRSARAMLLGVLPRPLGRRLLLGDRPIPRRGAGRISAHAAGPPVPGRHRLHAPSSRSGAFSRRSSWCRIRADYFAVLWFVGLGVGSLGNWLTIGAGGVDEEPAQGAARRARLEPERSRRRGSTSRARASTRSRPATTIRACRSPSGSPPSSACRSKPFLHTTDPRKPAMLRFCCPPPRPRARRQARPRAPQARPARRSANAVAA